MNQSQINSTIERVYYALPGITAVVKKGQKALLFNAQTNLHTAMVIGDMVEPNTKPVQSPAKEGKDVHQEIALRNAKKHVADLDEVIHAIDVTESVKNEELVDELKKASASITEYIDNEETIVAAKKKEIADAKEVAEKAAQTATAETEEEETKEEGTPAKTEGETPATETPETTA